MMPVQKATVPLFVKNYDCAVEAQTGSGKTLAFVIPIINQILKTPVHSKSEIRALIVSPTRELALQINEVVECFTREYPNLMSNLCLIGGLKNKSNIGLGEETGRNVIVATPGRLIEIIQEKVPGFYLNFKELHYLVLDEADRLTENNFYDEIKSIILKLPKQRRTGLFSATLTSAKMDELIKLGLRNPIVIKLAKKTAKDIILAAENKERGGLEAHPDDRLAIPEKLVNYYKIYESRVEKIAYVFKYLESCTKNKTIIFFNTCASVQYYNKLFKEYFGRWGKGNIKKNMWMIHGEMKQKIRLKNLDEFSKCEAGVIFATDVCARGIDIPTVNWIIQVDPPQDPMSYVHRIGRTARKGLDGEAVILLLESERGYLGYLESRSVGIAPLTGEIWGDQKVGEKSLVKFRAQVKEILLGDKDFLVKGSRAFVSFVRSYIEHKVSKFCV
jgi:ATP-dependent RNA helicase DDX55/SPB4